MFTTCGTYQWSFVTQIFHDGQPSRGSDRKRPLTKFVTRVTRQVARMEQELFTNPRFLVGFVLLNLLCFMQYLNTLMIL